MKILTKQECESVSAACSTTHTITKSSSSKSKTVPINGLFLMGMQVEDLRGNVIFSGNDGSFTFDGIDYVVKPSKFGTKDMTEYTFSMSCKTDY